MPLKWEDLPCICLGSGLSTCLPPSTLSFPTPAWEVMCLGPSREVLGSSPSPSLRSVLQVLHDCQRYRSNIREIGDLWVGVGPAP